MILSPTDRALAQLIRAAFPFDENGADAFDARAFDWRALAASARTDSLEPMLYASLKKLGLQERLPTDALENLRASYLRANVAHWMAFDALSRLIECFERAQIEFVLLKGCAIASLYPEPALRALGDLDILIRPAAVERAGALLVEQGYKPALADLDGAPALSSSEQMFVRRGKQSAQVDLHWHLLGFPYYCQRVPIEWFWQRTMPTRVNARAARMFAPEAQLTHLAAHFILHHYGEGMRWSYDLALVLTRHREHIAWDSLAETAHAFGLIQPLRQAVTLAADTWGLDFLSEPRARLEQFHLSARDRVAYKMATARQAGVQVFWDAFQLPGLSSKCAFLLRKTFPSFEYMRARYRITRPIFLPAYYLGRMGVGAFKFARSLFSVGAGAFKLLTRARLT